MFFESMIELVSGKNKEGYLSVLLQTFRLHNKDVPSKAAFCLFRKRISYKFFRDLLFSLIFTADIKRTRYRGFYIYAVDGFETEIPRSDDILNAGYRGRTVSSQRETYYPRMYMSHCFDVMNSITKDLVLDKTIDELRGADDIVPHLEKDSITLYDRYYFCTRLVRLHTKNKNYFIARCKTHGGLKEIVEFSQDPNLRVKVIKVGGVQIRLFKVINKKEMNPEKRVAVYATNLLEDWLDHVTIYKLYCMRWEVETSFKDLVQTLKVEDFHAKNENGVLQEIYAKFWLMNFVRIQILKSHRLNLNPELREYKKPNFKLVCGWVVRHFKEILDNFTRLWNEFTQVVSMSIEKRKRRSRHYPRELKYSGKMHPRNSTVFTLKVLT